MTRLVAEDAEGGWALFSSEDQAFISGDKALYGQVLQVWSRTTKGVAHAVAVDDQNLATHLAASGLNFESPAAAPVMQLRQQHVNKLQTTMNNLEEWLRKLEPKDVNKDMRERAKSWRQLSKDLRALADDIEQTMRIPDWESAAGEEYRVSADRKLWSLRQIARVSRAQSKTLREAVTVNLAIFKKTIHQLRAVADQSERATPVATGFVFLQHTDAAQQNLKWVLKELRQQFDPAKADWKPVSDQLVSLIETEVSMHSELEPDGRLRNRVGAPVVH